MRVPRFHDFLRLLGGDVAFATGRVRINRQPDNAFAGIFLLQLLHVAAAVMFFHERALGIKPFEDDVFTFVFGERLRLAVGVRRREVGRGGANRWNISGVKCAGCERGDGGEE